MRCSGKCWALWHRNCKPSSPVCLHARGSVNQHPVLGGLGHKLQESLRFGRAVRRAVEERYDGNVAVFASGSLSHHFADNGGAPQFMHKVYDPFLSNWSIAAWWFSGNTGLKPQGARRMPHLTIEYSANLRNFGGFSKLCNELAQVLVSQKEDGKPVYPMGGIRVRAVVAEHWCIGDGSLADSAFVHGRLQIGAGRSEEAKKATGDLLFEALKKHFAREFDSQGLALSLEMGEFSEAGTWKHNNLLGRYGSREG